MATEGSSNPVSLALPIQLKLVGYCNLVIGPLLAIVNLIVIGRSISRLEEIHAPNAVSNTLKINIAIFFALGILFLIGGVGLLLNRRWGLIWSFIAAGFSFFALLAVSVINQITVSLLQTGAIPLRPGQSFNFSGVAGVMAFAPLYAIVVIVVSMLPDARAWARRQVLPVTGRLDGSGESAAASAGRPTSGFAIASLVCAMIPFALLTQIAGLTLGIVALVKIKKSNGSLGGKGFAIAGIVISSLILFLIGGILLAIVLSK